jgi:tRNA modification GTPase
MTTSATSRPRTIFARATPPGRGAVAIIRLSGPDTDAALRALTPGRVLPEPRLASLRRIADPVSGRVIDEALVLRFTAPASYTGEDAAELQLHGGPAVVAAVIEVLGRLPGLRPAEAGEFTRRAVLSGRMDLTAAEAVADLIAADTAGQAAQALAQLGGRLGRQVEGWRARLIRAAAMIEAEIDFPDEEVPDGIALTVAPEIEAIATEFRACLADGRSGERLREGVVVAVVGRPNAGKSSLVNALAGREIAIVTDRPGTTRDAIEVALDLDGVALTLIDTAGLRDTDDPIEQEGVRRARARAAAADLRLVVIDPETTDPAQAMAEAGARPGDPIVFTRRDRLVGYAADRLRAEVAGDHPMVLVSCVTGAGMGDLAAALAGLAAGLTGGGEGAMITRARHRAALDQAAVALDAAAAGLTHPLPMLELVAEDLRRACDALGRITGRIDVEHLLDAIFREFCIGK